jgi:hypothetical protein
MGAAFLVPIYKAVLRYMPEHCILTDLISVVTVTLFTCMGVRSEQEFVTSLYLCVTSV